MALSANYHINNEVTPVAKIFKGFKALSLTDSRSTTVSDLVLFFQGKTDQEINQEIDRMIEALEFMRDNKVKENKPKDFVIELGF